MNADDAGVEDLDDVVEPIASTPSWDRHDERVVMLVARRDDAVDAAADAQGALEVARARLTDYESADERRPWQLIAAAEAVAKAERLLRRRQDVAARREAELQDALEEISGQAQLAELDPGEDPVTEPQLAYPDAATWVREWLAHNFKRRISKGSGHVWAADWWRYPEAVSRIEALWRAWEHLRLDPATGMSVWFRDHAEHHMRVLMDPDWGPFGKHGVETDDVTDPLPHEDPHPTLFDPSGEHTS